MHEGHTMMLCVARGTCLRNTRWVAALCVVMLMDTT
jgi:hypothetical protein